MGANTSSKTAWITHEFELFTGTVTSFIPAQLVAGALKSGSERVFSPRRIMPLDTVDGERVVHLLQKGFNSGL
jgi:hypothetical protein